MPDWTTADIPDQTGRTVIITGANSGLGEQAAVVLADAGAEVVLACRNVAKGQRVADRIGPATRVAELDLADLASVRSFAEQVDRVDVLINNAGVMAVPRGRTADGFEMQMGTNHLGHFALTGLLLDRITERVVTLSSGMHQLARLDVDDLNWEQRRYRRWIAYGDSKLANLMFGKELAARLSDAQSPVLSLVAHPGYAATELQGRAENLTDVIARLGNKTPLAQSAADGALPTLYAATDPAVGNGTFYGPRHFGGLRGAPGVSQYRKVADNRRLRERLWQESERLTGVTYRFS